jgi:hypothetical protein
MRRRNAHQFTKSLSLIHDTRDTLFGDEAVLTAGAFFWYSRNGRVVPRYTVFHVRQSQDYLGLLGRFISKVSLLTQSGANRATTELDLSPTCLCNCGSPFRAFIFWPGRQ